MRKMLTEYINVLGHMISNNYDYIIMSPNLLFYGIKKGLFEDGLSVIKSETVKSGWFIIYIERFRSRCGVVDKTLAL